MCSTFLLGLVMKKYTEFVRACCVYVQKFSGSVRQNIYSSSCYVTHITLHSIYTEKPSNDYNSHFKFQFEV